MKKFASAFVVGVCLISGSVFATQKTHKSHKAPHVPVTADQAQKAALAKYHGDVVVGSYLENEDGKWQYATFIKSGTKTREIMVDAHTGKIASVEVVGAKEVAHEKAAEAKRRKTGV